MNRTPLPENYPLRMKNRGEYIIKRKVAEGGFSLVYEAETPGGTAPVVIKEFFPAKGAFRNDRNEVVPYEDYKESFYRNRHQFDHEGVAGGRVAKRSFQTLSFLSCGDGYALLKGMSQDMVSISDLVDSWSEHPPVSYTGNLQDGDSALTDLNRLQYALHIIESVLSVLSKIHDIGYLHLDISRRNVIWAGADRDTGRNGAAFIMDYGCAAPLTNGVFQPSYQLSYSPEFVAPEMQKKGNPLTPATDLYSVGMLLFFLCCGHAALERSCNRRRQIVREIGYLQLPQPIKERLIDITYTATAAQDRRFQSASAMRKEIRRLDEALTARRALGSLFNINEKNNERVSITSIKEVMRFESSMFSHGDRYRRAIVDFICDESNHVDGTAKDYYRLILGMLNGRDYYSGLRLCRHALHTYPYDGDLLALAIQVASDSGQFDAAEEFFSTASTLDRSTWSPVLFLNSGNYYQARFQSNPKDRVAIERAIELAEEYMKYFPQDEYGYNQRAVCYMLENQREEAARCLRRWIFEQTNRADASSALNVNLCCVTLLDLWDDSHAYELIVKVAKRGIRDSKNKLWNPMLDYFAYRWALARDAQVADADYQNKEDILDALKLYQAAYDVIRGRWFLSTIEKNYSLLRAFVLNTDSDPGPLIARPPVEIAEE